MFDVSQFMAAPVTDAKVLNERPDDMRTRMEILVSTVQGNFCRALEAEETSGQKFRVDRWMRQQGGGGITCVLQEGAIFEKAGVNVSIVSGVLGPNVIKQILPNAENEMTSDSHEFFVAAISSIIQPRNPFVPKFHFNYRFFELTDKNNKKRGWFGGGADLTPSYLNDDDAIHFHATLKEACDRHDKAYYSKFKQWADEYLYIPHRAQCCGIGGIFFDELSTPTLEHTFEFIKSCAATIIPSYMPLISKHRNDSYGQDELKWHKIRHGAFAEFCLLYERGTKFGFNTPDGRHESILISMPLEASWNYNYEPSEGSREKNTLDVLRHPRDWLQVASTVEHIVDC